MNRIHGIHKNSHGDKCRRGPSSFRMHDSEKVFDHLGLKSGDTFVDLGCGPGDYSLRAGEIVGINGRVYGVDLSMNSLELFKEKLSLSGLINVNIINQDITSIMPIEEEEADVCFISTVLHTIRLEEVKEKLFLEIRRILKNNGKLAIIECKKEEMSFGPPMQMRYSPEEIEIEARKYGFEKIRYTDLGSNYMVEYVKKIA